MTYKELKKKYKGYEIIAFGVPLKDMHHCTPFTRLPKDKKLEDCEVVEYRVEEKERIQHGWHFPTMEHYTTKVKGDVYVYVR